MVGRRSPETLPLCLGPSEYPLFAFAGLPSQAPTHGILVCPPFAEEMNRSRRTVRTLCAESVRRGFAVINIDLHGTGDSSGDFGDARWNRWLDDLESAATWLREQDCTRISLLGIRAGALLARDLLRSRHFPAAGLVLWQPVLNGKSIVTDLLRTRIAAGAARGGTETVNGLRQQLSAGQSVEAAGYTLAPQLASALDDIAFDGDGGEAVPPVYWIEIVGDAAGTARPAAVAGADRLRTQGARVDQRLQQDPPFWSTTEITVGSGTVAATLAWLDAIQ